ncbi:hypothetical protein [Furfurilactobacillus entadae]|uniref:hypothetical protein n=1 Tax=Furfurilactobacillus entadae TaxID=2922307 RepID=UPI0035F05F71
MYEERIPRSEQETIITWDKNERKWYFYSDDPVHIKKWRKHIVNVRKEELYADGSPKSLDGEINGNVSVHGKRKMSDEQKTAFAERMKKANQS